MSKLSLRKHRSKNEESQTESSSPTSPKNVIEISTDESDTSNIHEIVDSDQESAVALRPVEDYDAETLFKFQKSTDSVQTDEDVDVLMFGSTSGLNPKNQMFSWEEKSTHLKQNNNAVAADSDSDDLHQKSRVHRKQKKKFKNTHTAQLSRKNGACEDTLPVVAVHHELQIAGIQVKLPVKPYSCQIAVMNKVILGCKKKENCLLESPTGSGKTLALLCSVLAWHDHHTAEVQREISQLAAGDSDTELGEGTSNSAMKSGDGCTNRHSNIEEDGDSDYDKMFKTSERLKIPKIYYGTRTHKQIEQVIRELRKTSYRHKKMTILSSREHTCLQQSTTNKTDLCNDLLDPAKRTGCPFYNEGNKKAMATFPAAKRLGLGQVWDIEELVTIGKEQNVCPYFAARNFMEHADIIFCPYNYIIDPDIRESMQLNLNDQVIILDEAHNIEDTCREVASVNFREDDLEAAAHDCGSLSKQRNDDPNTYNTLKEHILRLTKFIKSITLDKIDYNSNNLSSPYWTGMELLELYKMHELEESAVNTFLAACRTALQDCNKSKEESRSEKEYVKPVISRSTKIMVEHLMFTFRMITSPEFVNDYRACVIESTVKDFKYATDNTWLSTKKKEQRARTLKLLCMNPGMIFAPLAQSARSIILASGTLSPTSSFQSELSTAFVHVLNTAHVIPKDQVFATCIPKGPNNVSLRATYQNVNSWGFQDELGKVLLDICESVPHGILCFFSSYNVMHTQMERWQNNSIWSKISNVKQVFIEPRYGGDLAGIMTEYREIIQETSARPNGTIDGALFLAVFRGKVAEGIDFKDNEARCVLTVGIPYGVRKDPVIDMKLKYNDMNTARGLLRGSVWYSIQAFRALNQALGRCLRHANDWGAVLLVDERFLFPENIKNLPKWVKTMWIEQSNYNLKEQLRDFVARQKARDDKT